MVTESEELESERTSSSPTAELERVSTAWDELLERE